MSADPVTVLEARVQRAEDRWHRGEFAAALHEYTAILRERLLEAGRGVKASAPLAADMVVAERVSDLAVLLGHADAADDLLAGVAISVEQAGNVFWGDYIRTKRIDMALARGLTRKAYELLTEMEPRIGDITKIDFSPVGLARWESDCRWVQADQADRTLILTLLYLCIGRILSSLGQYGDAITAIERGLFHVGADGAPDLARQARIPLDLSLAAALIEKGLLRESETLLTDLEPEINPARQPGRFVRWLELSGKLRLLTGNFGEALEKLRRALAFCESHRFEKAALAAFVNLAHVLIYFNQTGEARKMLEGAAAQARAMGDQATAARASALLLVAHARGASLADAVSIAPTITEHWGFTDAHAAEDFAPMSDESPLELPPSDNYLAFFEDRILGFHWLLARGDVGAAARFLAGMKESFQDSDSLLIRERLRVLDSIQAYYQGDYRQAEILLTRSLTSLREFGLLPELWQAQRLLGWCMVKLGSSESMRDALTKDTSRLLGQMTASLPHEERAVFLLNKWTAEEEYIAGEVNQLKRLKAELETSSWWRKPSLRWRLWRRLDALMAYIDHYKHVVARRTVRGEDEAADAIASPASLVRRLWQRPRRETLISFLVLPDRVLLIRAGWFSLDFGVSAATRIQVRELVHRWHEMVSLIVYGAPDSDAQQVSSARTDRALKSESIKSEMSAVAGEIASILQLPILLDSLPTEVRSITIVPDDSLHGFPFAAIYHKGKYLIENYALSYAFEHGARPTAAGDAGRRALTVGVSEGTPEYDPLFYVIDEINLVTDWLVRHQASVRKLDDTGEQSDKPSKALLLDNLPAVAFAHIACHGIFEPDLPDHSGMIFPSSTGESEVLSVRELSTLNLQSLKHITLSSCWSADHFILPGRWVISLPETLWRAGSGSVLGCLWLVNDHVGMKFMSRFYAYLETQPRQEALRQAQRDCLSSRLEDVGGVDTTHPIYWAGYQLYGDNSELNL